jgi:hypothetical protein
LIETILNSRIQNPRPQGVQCLSLFAIGVRSHESMEPFAGRIKRALFLLREAAIRNYIRHQEQEDERLDQLALRK